MKNKKNLSKKTLYILGGIIIFLALFLIYVYLSTGFHARVECNSPMKMLSDGSCCLDANNNYICDLEEEKVSKQRIESFDSSKIIISKPTVSNEIYWNALGGPASVTQNLIINNNNDIPVWINVGFSPSNVVWFMSNKLQSSPNGNCYDIDAIFTSPDFNSNYSTIYIDAHSSRQVQISINSGSTCAGVDSFRDITPSASNLKTSTTLQVQLVKNSEQNNINQLLSSQLFTVTLHCMNKDGTDDCQKISQGWE